MYWREFCLGKAEECELLASDPAIPAPLAREWRLMAADWRAAGSANDDVRDGEEEQRS
jgi:hypothetical protein